jgi:hypothetical protein
LENGKIVNLNKASKRDRDIERRRNGHREDGRSVRLIKEEQIKRALRIKKEQQRKRELLEGDEA